MRIIKLLLATVVLLIGAFWVSSYLLMRDTEPHAYAPVTETEKQEAEAYIASGLASMPTGWKWGTFEPQPGVVLRTGQAKTSTSPRKGTVVLVPGYTAMLELYSETFQTFLNDGYDVAALEYRGQGLSHRELDNPEKGYVSSYDMLTGELADFINQLKVDGAGPVHIYANSMGGHIALRMAGQDRPDVASYFLLVPMVKIETGDFPYGVARVLAGFYSYTGLGNAFAPGQGPFVPGQEKLGTPSPCMNNAKTAQIRDALFIRNEAYRVTGTTNDWVTRTMASTDLIASQSFVDRVKKPVFMVTAGDDRWVSTEAATQLCERLSSCEIAHYEESRHCIAREKPETAQDIFRKAKDFFAAN
ncbi:MAG: alpha/beta hydrolase [Ahrensia sp.]|nr:alpha/beta hydrolase [Ahrensia sp.]